MLVALHSLNNITAYRLIIICRRVLSDNYRHQITNDFEKLLVLKDVENTSMITAPILLVLRRHIGLTRLLKNSAFHAEFDAEGRLCPESTSLDWNERSKIERAIAADKDEEDEKNPWEKNKQLKREKQRQK